MKRELLGLCTVAALGAAQTALAVDCLTLIWCDNFDNYDVNELIIGQDCGTLGCPGDPSPNTCVVGNRWASWNNAGPPINQSRVVADPGPQDDPVVEVDSHQRNPASSEDLVHEWNSRFPNGLVAGTAYKVGADVWLPTNYPQANCNSYFILLNTYSANGTQNWSTQLHFDAASGNVISDFDDGVQRDVNYVTGAWIPIEVIIVVDSDTQIINYNNQLVVTKSWREGVSGGGAMDLEATDLYPNDCDVQTYYDNLQICTISPTGACCHDNGSCQAGVTETVCEQSNDGFFLGIGSACGAGACPVRGANGWIVTAPIVWDGSGHRELGRFDQCDIVGGPDDKWIVTIPWAQEWNFNACETDLDTVLAIGTTDCDDNIAFNDDGDECAAGSLASQVRVELPASSDAPVRTTLEDATDTGGPFTLVIEAQCPRLAATPGATPEPEACGADTDGGCNMDTPAFLPIVCGQTYRGTHWQDGAARDTDWYRFVVTEDTEITITGNSVFAGAVFGVIQDSDTQDCEQVSVVTPLDTTGACLASPRAAVVNTVLAHTNRDGGDPLTTGWWLFSAPAFGGPIRACDTGDPDGQNGFTFKLECGKGCPGQCEGDLDGLNGVGFPDLLIVLAAWGDAGGCADLDGSGTVGFQDLLVVLAQWGPCP
jgi:hypothetical protein